MTSLRIAVVDDNRDTVDSLGVLLECYGHEVLRLYSADHVVTALAAFRADAIVMDIAMPRITGLDAIRQVRGAPSTASVLAICVTGRTRAQDRKSALDAGFDAYLVKPHAIRDLLTVLDGVAGAVRSRDAVSVRPMRSGHGTPSRFAPSLSGAHG